MIEKEPKPQFTIRKASLEDVEAIRAMQAQSWRDTYQNDDIGVTKEWLAEETASWLTPDKLDDSKERFKNFLSDPAHFYRIALQGGEVVGLLHLDTKEDGSKHLWGLYTAAHTHGSGLAQKLMALADEWVGESDVDLEVASYNERAKAFYRKYGFVETEILPELFKDKIPTVKMVRKGDKT